MNNNEEVLNAADWLATVVQAVRGCCGMNQIEGRVDCEIEAWRAIERAASEYRRRRFREDR